MSNAHWKNYLTVILNIAMSLYNVNVVLTVVLKKGGHLTQHAVRKPDLYQ